VRPELLLTEPTAPVGRYRRRIIGVGMLAAVVLVAAGAPFYLRAIERDLERRVPAELAAAGVTGLAASFSGQQGVLRCSDPLSDPEGVLDVAHEIDGVATVTLDRSCRVSSVATVAPPVTAPPGTSDAEGATDDAEIVDEQADPATTAAADFDTVGEIVGAGPRLSVLKSLVGEAGLDAVLDGPEPLTLFAPDNAAFDEVSADVLAELRNDPELLAEVLRHHLVPGRVTMADLDDLDGGSLGTLHAAELVVGRSGDSPTISGATVVEGDLAAGNGVVHVIDRLVLPADLELRSLSGLPEFAAVLRGGTLDLSGAVTADAHRDRLVAAATGSLQPVNVTHDIEIDPDSAVGESAVEALVDLLDIVPGSLTTGTAGFDGSQVFVVGTVVDAEALAVITEAAERHEVRLELVERPVATTDDIEALAAELDALVSAEPFEFAPNSADLGPGAEAVLDRAAAIAKRFDGVLVTVEGHTDTAGSVAVNLELSELRAGAVHLGLLARGVPDAQLTFVGRGGDSPVVVDGFEDAAASRRVVFVVALVDPV
jgi:uncharacterized surface protein with fasciclin (FAS1) repeats/outer membrane protein OmpA-like peptidoglycan-associated protein